MTEINPNIVFRSWTRSNIIESKSCQQTRMADLFRRVDLLTGGILIAIYG